MKKSLYERTLPVIWSIMRINALVIAFLCSLYTLSIAGVTHAQGVLDKRITFTVKDIPLSEVLERISEQADVKFAYSGYNINEAGRVSVQAHGEKLKAVLPRILTPSGLTYRVVGKNIVLLPLPEPPPNSLQSSQTGVSGTVTDTTGTPLPGVGVQVKGTDNGAVTDLDGRYELLNVPDDATLVFSFVGMKTQEIPASGKKSIDVVMREDAILMNEVVAIGYGSVQKRDLTGAVSSIRSEELTRSNSTTFAEAIQGKIAGVRVNLQSGEPGASVNIEIRGANSINAGSAPLYVIDGIPIDVNEDEVATSNVGGTTTANPLATISPEDIESIEFLKDASAAAIYGARGANGVIIVTTKSGKEGTKARFNVNTSYGFSEITKGIDMLGAQEYVNYRYERSPENPSWGTDTDEDGTPDAPRDISGFGSHSWQDELFRTGSVGKINLSMQGGSESTTYSGSLGYLNQHALVDNNDYQSYSARLKLDHRASEKVKAGISANWGRSVNSGVASSGGGDGGWSGLVQSVYTYRPVLVYDPDTEDEPISLASMIYEAYKKTGFNRIMGRAYVDYKIVKNLSLNVSGGGTYTSSKLSEFYGSNTTWGRNSNGRARLRNTESGSLNQTSTLNYNRNFGGDHVLKVMGGFEVNTYKYESFLTRALDFEDQSTGVFDISKGLTVEPPTSFVSEVNRMSFFGRVNYNIKEKYLFTGTFRADGSSNFGRGNRFGYFPSAAFAWRIIQEPFMNSQQAVSDLKLRLSYGITGNDRIPAYRSRAELSTTYYSSGGNVSYGVSPTSSENPDLKWETTTQYNAGLDFGIFDNRLTLTADVYYKKTTGMLLNAEVSSQSGFIKQWQNIGDMENKGLELALNTVNVDSRKFGWNTSANFYLNRNKVLSLGGTADIPVIFANGYLTNVGIVKEGEPLGTAYGYIWDGIYQTGDFTWQEDSDPTIPHEERSYTLKEGVPGIAGSSVAPGLFKYKDLNGDRVVNADDRKIISNSNPTFAGGISNEFRYSNFTLSLFFEGVYGNEIFNAFPSRVESGSGDISFNLTSAYWENRWTPDNPSNRYASIAAGNSDNISSTYYVEDGSYLRFRTLSLGYSLSQRALRSLRISSLRIYVTVDNLHVWTNYGGLDPDIRSTNRLLPGYDRLAYPRARTYMIGIDMSL